jgi:RimJ/RimL family protein N-acetyltransferase
MIIFETKRLLVRTYTKEDEDHFFALNGNEDVMRYIRPVKTRDQCHEFLLEVIAYAENEKIFGRWAVENKETNQVVGSFGVIPVEGKNQMQLGYALTPENWGHGYATELTRAGLEYIFTKTSIDPIYAYTESRNVLSKKVLLKTGFMPNGENTEDGKRIAGFILSKAAYLNNKKETATRLLK